MKVEASLKLQLQICKLGFDNNTKQHSKLLYRLYRLNGIVECDDIYKGTVASSLCMIMDYGILVVYDQARRVM